MGAHQLPSVWALHPETARPDPRPEPGPERGVGTDNRGPGRHLRGAGAVWTPGPRGEPRQLALRLGGHVLQ